jgi:hypothetical protein
MDKDIEKIDSLVKDYIRKKYGFNDRVLSYYELEILDHAIDGAVELMNALINGKNKIKVSEVIKSLDNG